PPGLLELTEVVLCASQNLPARIRQPRGIRITKPIRAHAALLPDSLLSAAPASSVCIGPRASYRVKQNLGLAHGIELPYHPSICNSSSNKKTKFRLDTSLLDT